MQRRSRQRGEACACRLEDAKGRDQFHEGVDAGRFRGAGGRLVFYVDIGSLLLEVLMMME